MSSLKQALKYSPRTGVLIHCGIHSPSTFISSFSLFWSPLDLCGLTQLCKQAKAKMSALCKNIPSLLSLRAWISDHFPVHPEGRYTWPVLPLLDWLSTHHWVNHGARANLCSRWCVTLCATSDFLVALHRDSQMQMNCQCIDLMHQPWACSGLLQCLWTFTTLCVRTVHVCLSAQNRFESVEERW